MQMSNEMSVKQFQSIDTNFHALIHGGKNVPLERDTLKGFVFFISVILPGCSSFSPVGRQILGP